MSDRNLQSEVDSLPGVVSASGQDPAGALAQARAPAQVWVWDLEEVSGQAEEAWAWVPAAALVSVRAEGASA